MSHSAGASHWNASFRNRRITGDDLDWGGLWTDAFLPLLRQDDCRRVLDLGCGTGNDIVRVERAGFDALGMDLSLEALCGARHKVDNPRLLAADMSRALPFADDALDAVMANVSVHMFDDATTRRLFAELRRIVSPSGLLLLHVNAQEDRPLRARNHPPERELEPDFVLEQDGQTMHFFSESYLRELLADWSDVDLERVTIPHRETDEPFKIVWRIVATWRRGRMR